MKKVTIVIIGLLAIVFIATLIRIYFKSDIVEKPHLSNEIIQQGFASSLPDYDAFSALSGPPLMNQASGVQAVKMILELRTGNLYFAGHKRFQLHYNFCNEILGFNDELIGFNLSNYESGTLQKFILADLNYYTQSDTYVLEFTSSSKYSAEQIERMFNACVENSYIKNLKLLKSSDYIVSLGGQLKIPTIEPNEIYGKQLFQNIQSGEAFGYLCYSDSASEKLNLTPRIVVVKGTPLTLPECTAIISDQFQSPLSHIQVLSHHRNIPAATYTLAWQDAKWRAMENQFVHMTIYEDSVTILESTPDEAEKIGFVKRQKEEIVLTSNTSDMQLAISKTLRLNETSIERFGIKASAVGELAFMQKEHAELFEVPKAIAAIPFGYYKQHIKRCGADEEISKLEKTTDSDAVLQLLQTIRKKIRNSPVDQQLVNAVSKHLQSFPTIQRFRFRSSSNAEDGIGFSGAGLYDSETAVINDPEKTIERAIQKVWASLWRSEAYEERAIAGIRQSSCAMAILIHQSFSNEIINGVAITTNLYRKDFPGLTLSMQPNEYSVVSPAIGEIPEEIVLTEDWRIRLTTNVVSTHIVRLSDYSPNASLINQQQQQQLFKAFTGIHEHFSQSLWGESLRNNTIALDLEWKILPDGKLVVKQVRPYVLR